MLEIKIDATITVNEGSNSLIDDVLNLLGKLNGPEKRVQTQKKDCCEGRFPDFIVEDEKGFTGHFINPDGTTYAKPIKDKRCAGKTKGCCGSVKDIYSATKGASTDSRGDTKKVSKNSKRANGVRGG